MSDPRMDYRQLLVAVDLGDATEHVVRRGVELGRRLGAAVDVANALEKAPGYLKHTLSREDLSATHGKSRRWSQERLEDLKGRYPSLRGTHTPTGPSADEMRSRGFAVGSPPPSRADTVTSRMSLVQVLPRFLSWAALRCLMLAHLL